MKLTHKLFLLTQDLFIKYNSFISPAVIHNTQKHEVIKKALFYKHIEDVEGDYLEFGVYEGTSLKGAAAYWKRISKENIDFYGFDSFSGMRLEKSDAHKTYGSMDFSTDFQIVKKRFKNFPNVNLIRGYYQDTLKIPPQKRGINKASVIMIDCDLKSSAKLVFNYIRGIISEGTILILDDYFNYKADSHKGVQGAFHEFIKNNKLSYQELIRYGIGGYAVIITK